MWLNLSSTPQSMTHLCPGRGYQQKCPQPLQVLGYQDLIPSNNPSDKGKTTQQDSRPQTHRSQKFYLKKIPLLFVFYHNIKNQQLCSQSDHCKNMTYFEHWPKIRLFFKKKNYQEKQWSLATGKPHISEISWAILDLCIHQRSSPPLMFTRYSPEVQPTPGIHQVFCPPLVFTRDPASPWYSPEILPTPDVHQVFTRGPVHPWCSPGIHQRSSPILMFTRYSPEVQPMPGIHQRSSPPLVFTRDPAHP